MVGGCGGQGDTTDKKRLARKEPLALAVVFRLPQRVYAGLSGEIILVAQQIFISFV